MRCRSLAFFAVLLMVPIAALAQTNPFDGLNARGRAYLDASVYAQQKAQWLARVDAMPENVDVLEGAAESRRHTGVGGAQLVRSEHVAGEGPAGTR